jgi:hypothetical protein
MMLSPSFISSCLVCIIAVKLLLLLLLLPLLRLLVRQQQRRRRTRSDSEFVATDRTRVSILVPWSKLKMNVNPP